MMEQLALFDVDQFEQIGRHGRTPTWDDVGHGAHLVTRIVPCTQCMMLWDGMQCRSRPGNHYAYPKSRPGGMCAAHFIEWDV